MENKCSYERRRRRIKIRKLQKELGNLAFNEPDYPVSHILNCNSCGVQQSIFIDSDSFVIFFLISDEIFIELQKVLYAG